MRDNAYRLNRMVSDVLELNRRDRVLLESIPFSSFMNTFVADFAQQEDKNAGAIRIDCAADVTVTFDRVHLTQILWNLIRNAWRYAATGPAGIRIFVTTIGHGVELNVSDDGPGVPEHLRAQLFEPFFTTDSRGTGLGLYISRGLAEANVARLDYLPGKAGAHFRLQCAGGANMKPNDRRGIAIPAKVLVVDDEADIRELLELSIIRMGYAVISVDTVKEAQSIIESQDIQLCLTDMRLPDGDGLEIVRHIAAKGFDLPVAVITAHGSTENAVAALKSGAFDYLSKPLSLDQPRTLVKSALALPKQAIEADDGELRLLGGSPPIEHARGMIIKLSRSQAPIYVTGESGSGKELAARLIHANGARREKAFLPVNCGAIPENLMESEFFGYRKGAFTGAEQDRSGFFHAANGGTLFLDEMADLPLHMQVKLLRAIQEKRVRKVGATAEDPVDVRIICATHQNLAVLVEGGKFRQDLYCRMNVIELRMPPIRECREDIPELARAILGRLSRETCRRVPRSFLAPP